MLPRLPSCAAILAGAALLLPATADARSAPRTGPSGSAFYKAPSKLPGKRHGDLIWTRPASKAVAISPKGGTTRLVLYRSTGLDGKPIAVSGAVTVPKGKAPRGGWPVISWAHGTAGIDDACAPSRDVKGRAYPQLAFPLLQTWLKRGWAIVRTDYEGLGTKGEHPYLFGAAEGRGVLDIVRAARQLDRRLSKRVILSGHSQGGQATLFAAALGSKYTPELDIRGADALAPSNHLSELAPAVRILTTKGGLSAYVAMILRAYDVHMPELELSSQLSSRGRSLIPTAARGCYSDLVEPAAFGSVAPADFGITDTGFARLTKALDTYADPENLKVRIPVRLDQGESDSTVFPSTTKQLADEYRAKGTDVELVTYPGIEHNPLITAARTGATAWIANRLR